MLIPEDMLQELLCSICKKYLSVQPIKVYHNRQIKCGRCSKISDEGVPSKHFNMIIKNFLFPCVNRYQGCNEVLSIDKVSEHETKCNAKNYTCPLCKEFKSSTAYYLQLHLKEAHPTKILRDKTFCLQIDQEVETIVWYLQANILLFVYYQYDLTNQKLWINLCSTGKKCQDFIKSGALLMDGQVKADFETICSSETVAPKGQAVQVDIDPKLFPKNEALCKLYINDLPKWVIPLKQELPYVEPSVASTVINCVFKDYKQLRKDQEIDFEPWFYLKNLRFKIGIKIVGMSYVSIYMRSLDLDNKTTSGLEVKCSIPILNFQRKFTFTCKEVWQKEKSMDLFGNFISWDILMQGYSHYANLQIHAELKFTGRPYDV